MELSEITKAYLREDVLQDIRETGDVDFDTLFDLVFNNLPNYTPEQLHKLLGEVSYWYGKRVGCSEDRKEVKNG